MDINDNPSLPSARVAGYKQTIRSIENGKAKLVYIAKDADRRLIQKLKDVATNYNVKYQMVESMILLGQMAGLKIETSAACTLKEN